MNILSIRSSTFQGTTFAYISSKQNNNENSNAVVGIVLTRYNREGYLKIYYPDYSNIERCYFEEI